MKAVLYAVVVLCASLAAEAAGDILLVPAQYPTIQAAIDSASDGDEIRISPGIYAGCSSFLSVTLRGMGTMPGDTLITGSVSSIEPLQLRNLRFAGGVSLTGSGTHGIYDCMVNFVGVTIEFTNATIERTRFEGCVGTALTIADGAFMLVDSQFVGNASSTSGGAVRASDALLAVDECDFTDNHANTNGGAIYASSFAVDVIIERSTFKSNTADGNAGALYFSTSLGGACVLFDCDFLMNQSNGNAGAVRMSTGIETEPPGSVSSCSFQNNSAAAGPGNGAIRFQIEPGQPLPPMGSTLFCGNTPDDVSGLFFNIGGNSFADDCPDPCVADTNGDGQLTAADFSAWIAAFNAQAPECDQNADALCTAADFSAWIANYNAGCP